MFAGIVEAKARLLDFTSENQNSTEPTRIKIEKPIIFNDISIGDSIAVNGVCLTVEAQSDEFLQFCLGVETLRVTNWSKSTLAQNLLNLERSLKLGDRIHGHLVSGHIDSMGVISYLNDHSGCRDLQIVVGAPLLPLIWPKGSITINGVSLTVNDVNENFEINVTLVPETLLRTNLAQLKIGDEVAIEVDQMARGLVRILERQNLFKETQRSYSGEKGLGL